MLNSQLPTLLPTLLPTDTNSTTDTLILKSLIYCHLVYESEMKKDKKHILVERQKDGKENRQDYRKCRFVTDLFRSFLISLLLISQKSGMHFPRPIVSFFLFAVFCSSTVRAKHLYDSSSIAGRSFDAHSTNADLHTKISKTQNRLTHFSLKSVPQYLSRPQPDLIIKLCTQNFSV